MASAMSSPQLRLNLTDGSVSFSFSPDAARELKGAIGHLMDRLKAAAAQGSHSGTRPTPQQPMEYYYTGEVFLEVFCNPNIWSSPFAARLLITLRDDRIRLNTEAELTQFVEDLQEFLDQHG